MLQKCLIFHDNTQFRLDTNFSTTATICRFVKYCMSMVDLLLHHGVQPIVVLDGDKMPAKAITEQQRQRCEAFPAVGRCPCD